MTARLQAPPLATGTWTVSDSRTRVVFAVRSHGGGWARGSVACRWGCLQLDAEGAPVRAHAELDLDSLDTGIAKRDADLRKPRFLDIDRHPVMTWSADRFDRADDGSWIAEGTLAVRGASAPLTVAGGTVEVDPAGGWLRVSASGVLDRTAVGIRAPRLLIGRWVRVDVDAWLTPTPK